jgi:hypothetical protein
MQEEKEQVYTAPEMDDFTPETYDEYLAAQELLPLGDSMQRGKSSKEKGTIMVGLWAYAIPTPCSIQGSIL